MNPGILQKDNIYRRKSFRDDYTTPIKVAIYGRVSTTHIEQLSAFQNQMEWYQMVLANHPNYEVVGIYSETGSGTSTAKRKEFQRMIEDAIKGKFQLILTREVCRFARNTIDSLSYTRLLSAHDCEVCFCSDSIFSRDPDGELRLTIFAALAQDEARKISERVRNGQLVSRSNGVLYGNNAFGYRHIKGEKSSETHYEINSEEAETVRMIFSLYLQGHGLRDIVTQLVKSGRRNREGLVKWDCTRLSRLMNNKLYCGYMTYNKSAKPDFLSKRIEIKDQSEFVYIKSDKVPAIISEDEWNKVQEIKASKKKTDTGRIQCKRPSEEKYVSKLVCSCGKTFKKFKWHVLNDGSPVYGYECRNRKDNCSKDLREASGVDSEGYCNQPSLCQWKLDLMLENIVYNLWDNPKDTVDKLLLMISGTEDDSVKAEQLDRIENLTNEITKAEVRRENLEMKWLDGKLTDDDHERLCSIISKNIDTFKAELKGLQNSMSVEENDKADDIHTRLENIRKMEAVLTTDTNLSTLKLDTAFVDAFVGRIVPNGRTFKWYLNIGSGRGWSFFSEKAYELYDYWTIGFDTAKRYRKARNQYLRKNQWEDLKVEVYVRTR